MSSPDLTAEPRGLRRANDAIDVKTLRPPAALFDEFWREGELAMLFGAAGAGKSLLAVQIGDALARGRGIDGFEMSTSRRNVLYVDLVLSDEQFAMRYSRETLRKTRRAYKFSAQLFRERPAEGGDMAGWLRAKITDEKISVVIIDDLSVISQSDDGTRETLELMRELRTMTRELGVSVLVLADSHPLIFERSVAERDLRRNRVLCAFADSVFAIEAVYNTDRRNLVQTRAQAGEPVWTHRSPVRLDLAARDDGFVGFEREEMNDELRKLIVQVKEMHDNGESFRTIANKLEISKSNAARLHAKWTARLESEGVSEGETERDEADFPGCEEYDVALDDHKFDILYSGAEDEDFEPSNYEERLLKHEYDLIQDARDDAEWAHEDTGTAPRLVDNAKYKEFLECLAAGGDPLADEAAAPGSPPYKGGVAAASADGVVFTADSEVVNANENRNSLPTDNKLVDGHSKNHPVPIKNIGPPLLRKEGSFRAADSALHTPHSALQRSVDAYGKEIFVEKQDERGRPVIWYKLDRRGRQMRYLRKGNTVRETAVARIAESQA